MTSLTPRRFLGLLVAALAVIAFAFWLSTQRYLPRDTDFGETVLPGLAQDLDAITSVRITGAGSAPLVTLDKQGADWRVTQIGYPADAGRVRGLLRALAEATVVEPKTAQPANHAVLGVEDVAATGATGVQVELRGAARPYALVVGRTTGPRSVYVRRPDSPQALEARPALEIGREPRRWLARTIVDVPAERLQSLELDGATHALAAGQPAAGALGNLELDDVKAASAFTPTPTPRVATFRTQDGLAVRIEGHESGADRWIAVAATAEQPAAAAEAQRLAERTRGWYYRVPPFRFDTLFRTPEAPPES